ncbi:MAG: hypothetical protein HOP10_12575 [Chitinophagaceae bacterium]|nr:hypothetical protein [Chitinophagaceae bacterium]
MQTARIVQAVALMLIVAMAASCAATKEYASKIFPTQTEVKDSQAVALRFLELDKLQPGDVNWVTTDIIMGRDTGSKTAALDKLSEVFPATGATTKPPETETKPVYVNSAPVKADDKNAIKSPSASVNKKGTSKETKITPVVITEKKTEPVTEPVARNYSNGEGREKRTREDKP